MRRLLLSLVVLALTVPATAQMRGARGGGARVASGRGPVITTVRPSKFGGVSHFNRFGFRNRGFRHGFRNGFNNCGFGRFGFNNGFGFGFNNGFCNGFGFNNGFGFGGGLPLYYGEYDSGYTGAAYAEHALRYDDSRDREMNELLMDLRDQQRQLDYMINNMQQQQQGGGQQQQQAYPQQQGPGQRGSMLRQQMRGSTAANVAPNQPATTLVFKDGHRVDVQNYVIAKNTITILDQGRREHIPLAQIDVPATQKANEERGVDFKAPTVRVSLMCNPADANVSCSPHENMTEAQRALTP
jgi:hypothetical protein